MAKLSDMEMPPKSAPEMDEEFDFGDEFAEGEEEEGPDLAAISDDRLIEEMKKRGFDVEDEPEETGEMEEDMDLPSPESEEPLV